MGWGDVAGGGRVWAIARTWSLDAALAVAVAVGVVALTTSGVYLEVPFLRNRTTVLHVVPVLAAMALGFPLVDRLAELSLLAPRPAMRLPLIRVAAVATTGLPVMLALVLVGWTPAGASVVLGFLGLAAASAALLRLWYWAPMFVVMVAWAHQRPAHLAAQAGDGWLVASLATLLAGAVVHVAVEAARVRRAVRGVSAESAPEQDLDTIRP